MRISFSFGSLFRTFKNGLKSIIWVLLLQQSIATIFNLACASWLTPTHPLTLPHTDVMWMNVRYCTRTYCLHVQYVLVGRYCTCTVGKKEQEQQNHLPVPHSHHRINQSINENEISNSKIDDTSCLKARASVLSMWVVSGCNQQSELAS